ncbi:carboxylesterase/lipase family protein [Nonomuraea sp. NPDC050394]|uniref:carboxylesterase/lipase family protein n=1 Tax=Nonomuraea sp. NPDC050394 TaxID=3364363 RepID=UPI0037AB659D
MRTTLALLTAALALGAAAPPAAAIPPADAQVQAQGRVDVRTDKGKVRGVTDGRVNRFLGVPYAAPPVGALRWASPRPAVPWKGVRDAAASARRCPQSPQMGGGDSGVEDCLYLEVTAPAKPGKRPVVVWFHGGVGMSGAASEYNADRLVAGGDVVVVSAAFRIGILGGLQHPALDAASSAGDSGFWGTEDRIAALRWVKANIAAFGGDPGNVTIGGQSAGSTAVCGLLAAPPAAGLFHRAILQSGPCKLRWAKNSLFEGTPANDGRPRTHKETLPGNLATAANLGCADRAGAAACLRGLSVEKILQVQAGAFEAGGGSGSAFLPKGDVFGDGRFNRVPVLIGATKDESRLFMVWRFDGAHPSKPLTAAGYPVKVRESFGADAPKILRRYPLSGGVRPAEALGSVYTDHGWFCSTVTTARAMAGKVPVHAFEFAEPVGDDHPGLTFRPGAWHGAELRYLFDMPGAKPISAPAQKRLAAQMIGYWSNFARTGDPNGRGLPYWPKSKARGGTAMSISAGDPGPRDVGKSHNCGFWERLAR